MCVLGLKTVKNVKLVHVLEHMFTVQLVGDVLDVGDGWHEDRDTKQNELLKLVNIPGVPGQHVHCLVVWGKKLYLQAL